MQTYVKKIHFKLHESYENPNRIIIKPPYEVSETGWGEFEVVIKIYFHDPTIYKPVTFYHILKLFQPPSDSSTPTIDVPPTTTNPPIIDTKKRLVSEFYDEIVFYEPSQLMQQMLNTIQPVSSGSWTHDTDCKQTNEQNCFADNLKFSSIFIIVEDKKVKTLDHIQDTRIKVKAEIAQLKERLQQAREKIAEYKELMGTEKKQP